MVIPITEVVVHPGEATIHAPQQFYSGDTWEIQALCENVDGTPMDLAGATVTWKLNDPTGLTSFLTLDNSTDGGILVEVPTSGDRPTGLALITVTPLQTVFLLAGYYKDQLVVVSADGIASTIWQGRIQVLSRLL